MIGAATVESSRRLEQLYEIGKLFNAFEGAASTLDRALAVVAAKLPLESAILIETATDDHTEMMIWPAADLSVERLRAAKDHAVSSYSYLMGAHAIAPRVGLGRTSLRVPARDLASSPDYRFVVLPLVVGRRAVFGALQLEGARNLDRDDLEFINAIVNQLAVALDRNRAAENEVARWREASRVGEQLRREDTRANRRARDAEQFLIEAGASLSQSLERSDVAITIARLCVPRLADTCFVDLVTIDGRLDRVAWVQGGRLANSDRAPRTTEALARALEDAMMTDRVVELALEPTSPGEVCHATIVPLLVSSRRLGALILGRSDGVPLSDHARALAHEVARRSALAIDHARLYEQARQAVAARDQTLAVVSHDLRSPLNVIVLAASALADAPGTMSWRSLVDRIRVASARMDRMIADLVDFASIEAGRLAMTLQLEDVGMIVAETAASFESIAKKAAVSLSGITIPDLPLLPCDRGRILQVLANLVGNALKSAPLGALVWVGAEHRCADIVFMVSDNGPGIAAPEQQQLFDRHWRSPTAGYKGTGLGLAIARGIVEAHHGKIWVESQLDRGATFYFSIPL